MRNPAIMLFFSREAGILVLMELARASIVLGSNTLPLSLASLGERLAVSRAQVRQLLLDAAAEGLVELDQKARRITLKPALLECLDQFIAEGMSNHDLTGAVAVARVRKSTGDDG